MLSSMSVSLRCVAGTAKNASSLGATPPYGAPARPCRARAPRRTPSRRSGASHAHEVGLNRRERSSFTASPAPVQHRVQIRVGDGERVEQEFAAGQVVVEIGQPRLGLRQRVCRRALRCLPVEQRQEQPLVQLGADEQSHCCSRARAMPPRGARFASGKRSATYCRIAAFSVSSAPSSMRIAGTRPSGLTP